MPIGACIGLGAAGELLEPGNHGTTFGGNPVAGAAALAVLATIENEGLLDAAARVGEQLRRTASPLDAEVTQVDGRGLLLGTELAGEIAAAVVARGPGARLHRQHPGPTGSGSRRRSPHRGRRRRASATPGRASLHAAGARMTRHFLRDDDLTPAEQAEVLDLAADAQEAPYDAPAARRARGRSR